MSLADWTLVSRGTISSSIVADAGAPTPPDVLEISATAAAEAAMAFQNITGGPFKNSRISAWFKDITAGIVAYLFLRSLDNTTFDTAPATAFAAKIRAPNATDVTIDIAAIVNGVSSTIITSTVTSVNGDARASWQQFQFSTLNQGSSILLRVSQWNGAAFVPMVDTAVPIASFPTLDAAGSARFGILGSGLNAGRVDDVNYYSLT